MVKTPKTRHSRTRREPVTIDLESSEISRTESGPEDKTEILDLDPSTDTPAAEIDARAEPGEGDAAGGSSPAGAPQPSGTASDDARTEAATEPASDGLEVEWRRARVGPDPDMGSGGPREAESRATALPPADRRAPRRISVLAAGLIGGLVALAGGGLLQFAGLLGVPGSGPGAGLGGIETEIGTLRAEVAELRQQAANPADTAGLSGRLDVLAEAVERVKSDLASVQGQVRDAGGGNADLSVLEQRVSGLETAVADLGPASGSPPPQEIASLAERVSGLDALVKAAGEADAGLGSRLGAVEQSLSSLGAKVEAQASQPEVARAIAAAALQSAIERGAPFQAEIETFAAVAPDAPEIAALRAHAQTGVATRAEIAAEMEPVADRMIAAADPPPPEADFFEQLLDSAGSLVTVRPIGAVEGAGVPETVARMEVAVKAGDLEKALAEYDTLPDAARAAGADLADRIRARVEVERLADQAIASAMKA